MQDFFVDSFADLPEKERNGALGLRDCFLFTLFYEGGEFEKKGIVSGC
jgi:hypothetical protein